MRVLVIGDPHARAAALLEFQQLAAAVYQAAAAVRPELIVVTGDLLHEHARVHTGALNAVLDFIRELSGLAPRGVRVLIGNHDLPSNQTYLEPRHAFNAIKDWPRVRVADTVIHEPELGFVYAPFVPTGRFVEALTATLGDAWRGARAVFAHQDFKGARHGGYVSVNGDYWDPRWPLVVSGHFHAHQWLKSNVCYVGAPAAHDYGDEAWHTVSLFDFNGSATAHRERETRLELGLPRRCTVELPLAAAAAYLPPAGQFTRLIVTDEPGALLAFRRSDAYNELRRQVDKLILRSSAPAPRLHKGGAGDGGGFIGILRRLVAQEGEPVQALFAELESDNDRDSDRDRDSAPKPGSHEPRTRRVAPLTDPAGSAACT
jgi:hypothetical protein